MSFARLTEGRFLADGVPCNIRTTVRFLSYGQSGWTLVEGGRRYAEGSE
jgi:hypothetical protein